MKASSTIDAKGIYSTASNVTSIQNNTIGSISMKYLGSTTLTATLNFSAIYQLNGGTSSISGNTIGSNTTANSIYVGYATGYYSVIIVNFKGVATYNTSNPTAANNTISNIQTAGNGTGGTCYLIHLYNATSNSYASENTIKNIASNVNLFGIYMEQSMVNEINNNQIYNLSGSGIRGIRSTGNTNALSSNISGNTINNFAGSGSTFILVELFNSTTINNNTTYSGSGVACSGIQATTCDTVTLNDNTVYNLTATSNGIFGLYLLNCGTGIINSNTLYNFTTEGSFWGIYMPSCTGNIAISNNSISNVSSSAAGGTSSYGIYASNASNNSSTCTIAGNSISNINLNLVNSGSTFNISVTGIYLYTISNSNSIYSNTISGITNTNTSTANHVAGIILNTNTDSFVRANIYLNNISNIGSYSTTGTGKGIYVHNGNSNIHNNFVCFNNSLSNTVYGIHCNSTSPGQTQNIFYNTVYIGGSNTRTGETVCLQRDYAYMTVQNNIFYNERISNGNNYAISNSINTDYNNFNLNYNLLSANDVNKVCRLSATLQSWDTYKNANTNDKWSWMATNATLPASSLFNNASGGNLTINTSNPACWYANGKGVPISGYDMDWSNAAGSRSTSVVNGATDIGADEFLTSTTPPNATHGGTLTAGSTSTYTFAGRTVAEIDWQTGSTPPSSAPVVKYFSGTNPIAPIASTLYFNCYWQIDVTPSTGYSYILKLFYTDAQLGTITGSSNLRMAKNHTGTSAGWACQCSGSGAGSTTVDATNRTITNVTPFTSFSIFTGTDVTNPLPVEFVSLDAEKAGDAVHVTWVTASEVNASHFIIERSYDGINFTPAGRTEASGTSNNMHTYNFYDRNADLQAAIIFYRLKQVDLNDAFTYSPMVAVKSSLQKNGSVVTTQPNPFNGETHITFNLLQDEKVAIDVYDLTGRVVWSKAADLEKGEQMVQIPESGNWNKGTYFMVIKGTSVNYSQKLIKF